MLPHHHEVADFEEQDLVGIWMMTGELDLAVGCMHFEKEQIMKADHDYLIWLIRFIHDCDTEHND